MGLNLVVGLSQHDRYAPPSARVAGSVFTFFRHKKIMLQACFAMENLYSLGLNFRKSRLQKTCGKSFAESKSRRYRSIPGSLFPTYQKDGNPNPRLSGNGRVRRTVRRKTYHTSLYQDNLKRTPNGKPVYLQIRFVSLERRDVHLLIRSLSEVLC